MVRGLIFSSLEVVHRVMQKRVLAINTAIRVVKAADPHGLLARVLAAALSSDHVDLAAHFHGVVQRVD